MEVSIVSFTDSKYGDYNYVYAGSHENISLGAQANASASVGASVFVAYNTSKDQIDPSTYAGLTGSVGGSADVKAIVGGGFNVNKFTGSGKEPGWKGVSIGASIGVGAGANLGAVNGTLSNTKLINDIKPTGKRNIVDRALNAINPVGSALITGAIDKIKQF